MIKNFIENEIGREVYPDDHLEFDLTIDSLGKVSLSSYIEFTFGVEVAEENLTKYKSIKELAEFIHEHKTQITEEKLNWADMLKTTKIVHVPSSLPTIVVFTGLSRLLFALLCKVKKFGKQNLPEGPFILAPNHESFLDGFLVISQLPRKMRNQVYSYATVQYFKQKWWRRFAAHNNIIVMDIQKNLKLSMQKLAKVLKEGKYLMIFPEGERSVSGNLQEFKQTFAF